MLGPVHCSPSSTNVVLCSQSIRNCLRLFLSLHGTRVVLRESHTPATRQAKINARYADLGRRPRTSILRTSIPGVAHETMCGWWPWWVLLQRSVLDTWTTIEAPRSTLAPYFSIPRASMHATRTSSISLEIRCQKQRPHLGLASADV